MRNVSATQITTFRDCARKWYLRYIKGIETPKTPQQVLGSDIHSSIEYYLKTGKIKQNDCADYVEAAVPHLPVPKQETNLVEHEFFLPTFPGGPLWHGFIDLLIDEAEPVVHDHKTTSDFRYAKTPAEMEQDTQLGSYARYVQTTQIEHLGAPTNVIARLLYLHTRRKTLDKRSKLVTTILTPTTVNAIWERDLEIVRQMVVVREAVTVEELPPTTSSCMKYGGCAYRLQCGLAIETNPGRKRAMDMSSFLERMKAQQAATATPGNGAAAAPSPTPTVPSVIVPPDAASPVTPINTTAAGDASAEPTKRGRPQLSEAEKEANKKKRAAERMLEKARKAQEEAEAAVAAASSLAPAPVAAPAPAPAAAPAPAPAPAVPIATPAVPIATPAVPIATPAVPIATPAVPIATPAPIAVAAAAPGFALYIDCFPVKGIAAGVVLFDDWIMNVIHDINNKVEVLDYRLLGFAQEKLALQAGLEKHMTTVPPVLIVSTSSSVAKDALQTLIPHAREVVRAMR